MLGVLKFACTKKELSCIIGNLFAELYPPCGSCGDDVITISGVAYTGERVELKITDWGFLYSGSAQDIERIRKGLCLYDKSTTATEKAK